MEVPNQIVVGLHMATMMLVMVTLILISITSLVETMNALRFRWRRKRSAKVLKASLLDKGDSPWDHVTGYAVRFQRSDGEIVDALAHGNQRFRWILHDFQWNLIDSLDLYDAWDQHARENSLEEPIKCKAGLDKARARLNDEVG